MFGPEPFYIKNWSAGARILRIGRKVIIENARRKLAEVLENAEREIIARRIIGKYLWDNRRA